MTVLVAASLGCGWKWLWRLWSWPALVHAGHGWGRPKLWLTQFNIFNLINLLLTGNTSTFISNITNQHPTTLPKIRQHL